MARPYVWQMIKEAVDELNGKASYSEIRKYLKDKWDFDKLGTINDQIQVLTVNHKSRINYPENNKPRLTNSDSPYDLLYATERGQVVRYNPDEHGVWEIYKNSNGKLKIKNHNEISTVNTFLFVWNPKRWDWDYIEDSIKEVEQNGKTIERWSCGNTRTIKPDDRVFLVKVGIEPKGIIAAGVVTTLPFLAQHWSGEDKLIHCVEIEFDVLLNPETDKILTIDFLKENGLFEQNWTPQASGISIRPELVDKLEEVWFHFINEQNIQRNFYIPNPTKTFTEGTATQAMQTRYERNPYARTACIQHYGYSCSVCNFDFENHYGKIGKEFIHVHHLTKVATVGKTYVVDPIKDLRPVCPNCHAMLHKENPPMTIGKLKSLLT